MRHVGVGGQTDVRTRERWRDIHSKRSAYVDGAERSTVAGRLIQHLGRDVLGRRHIAKAPSGHGVTLGEAVDRKGAVGHAEQRRDADVLAAEADHFVDLVRDDEQVVVGLFGLLISRARVRGVRRSFRSLRVMRKPLSALSGA